MQNRQHTALPLKYRPMTFADVVGQDHVVRTLRHAIESGRVANAYLFIGSRGIGKTTMSRIFAKALNCTGRRGADPCGECVNCREIAAGSSLDVIELDAASHNGVDDIKPIIESAPFKPVNSAYKIFIIDECHMLSPPAWNALLKTLEEPPPHVRFVFATTEGDKVLATIVSRCQRFDLRRIQTNDIVGRLRKVCENEGIRADDDALLAIARGAEGGMRDALSSLDQLFAFKGADIVEEDALGVFGLVSRSALEGLAGSIIAGDTAGILRAIETFDSAGKNMRRIAAELLRHFRNLVVCQALGGDSPSLEATAEQIRVLKEQSAAIDANRLFKICDLLAEAEDRLRYVLSVRTMIEMTLIRASRIASTATIEELMRAVRRLQGGDAPDAAPPAAPKSSASAPAPVPPPKPASRYAEHELPPVEALAAVPPPAAAPAAVGSKPPPAPDAARRARILEDPAVNAIMAAIPGATITDIKEGR